MKKGWIIGIIIILILVLVGGYFISAYNGLVKLNEDVNNSFANVDTQLQRRADLIPNLVNTVKGYVKHEQSAIDSVTNARASLLGAKSVDQKQAANDEMTSSLNRLLLIVENYPDLKANTQFTAMMDELSGTENRISVARKDYNDMILKYNKAIKTFPANLIANMMGFEQKKYFEVTSGKEDVPETVY